MYRSAMVAHGSSQSSDPAVEAVERLLSAATESAAEVPLRGGRPAADRALWFCACATEADAPTWLIYDTVAGGLGWRRVPDGVEVSSLVDSDTVAGAHVHPQQVLAWLEDASAEQFGLGTADRYLLDGVAGTIGRGLGSRP